MAPKGLPGYLPRSGMRTTMWRQREKRPGKSSLNLRPVFSGETTARVYTLLLRSCAGQVGFGGSRMAAGGPENRACMLPPSGSRVALPMKAGPWKVMLSTRSDNQKLEDVTAPCETQRLLRSLEKQLAGLLLGTAVGAGEARWSAATPGRVLLGWYSAKKHAFSAGRSQSWIAPAITTLLKN
jgi:hypothetical protein